MRLQHGFEKRFENIRAGYHRYLTLAMARRGLFAAGFLAFVLFSLLLVPFLGENFFPAVDAGEIALHVRAPVGTRIEETAALFDHIEARIRQVIPPNQLGSIVDNIGLPSLGHQSRLSQHRRLGAGGRRHPDLSERKSRSYGGLCETASRRCRRVFPVRPFHFYPPIL